MRRRCLHPRIMIAITSMLERERTAFAALCSSRGWPTAECDSVRAFGRLMRRSRLKVVLTRHKLGDGYSDDVIAALMAAGSLPGTKIIVLVGAGTPSAVEARQIALGADCVLRDPVRTEVLLEYLAKYTQAARAERDDAPRPPTRTPGFAGADLHPADRILRQGKQQAPLTPREVELVELLLAANGEVVTYETLYSEILGRRFRGDTSNMRVLLGKLTASSSAVGICLREWVEVIPKLGYRYRGPQTGGAQPAQPRHHVRSAA